MDRLGYFSLDNLNELTVLRTAGNELDFAVFLSEQSVITADTYVSTRMEMSAALTDDDAACADYFTGITLYAEKPPAFLCAIFP